MKKFFKEFRDFIQKGNILDLAVGIIIGTAFNKIVSSLVNDIIMPIVGLIGGKNIQAGNIELVPAVFNSEGNIVSNAVTLNYGNFIQFIIDFLIISLTVYIIVMIVNKMRIKAESTRNKIFNGNTKSEENQDEVVEEIALVVEKQVTTEEILMEIRDLLKENKS